MNKDLCLLLLEKLSDKNLLKTARTSKYFYDLFESQVLWRRRFLIAFPLTGDEAGKMLDKLEFESWKEFYRWIRKSYVYFTGDAIYKYSFKQRFCSERFKNCIKNNVNIDIDFSIIFDTKQTVLPDFIDRKLFLREIKRYIYSSGNAKIRDKIEFGYDAFYDEIIISKHMCHATSALEKLYQT